jgi:hypothetical protein
MIFQLTQSAHPMDIGREVLRYEKAGGELTLTSLDEVVTDSIVRGAPLNARVNIQQKSAGLVIRVSWPRA